MLDEMSKIGRAAFSTADGEEGEPPTSRSTSLGRGLAILRTMNATGKYVSLRQLHERTGIPKPSIVRLLKRFIADGYVAKVAKPGHYRLAAGITELSRGLDPAWAAIDALERRPDLLAEYKWPVAIGTREGASLIVLFSTRRVDSPYSFKPSTFGRHPPLLTLAMGMAYLAFCDDAERRRAAADIAASTSRSDDVLPHVDRVIAATRERGFGLRIGGKGEDTSVAVPIYGATGELIGVLAESSFAVVTTTDDVKHVARALTRTAAAIRDEILAFDTVRDTPPATSIAWTFRTPE